MYLYYSNAQKRTLEAASILCDEVGKRNDTTHLRTDNAQPPSTRNIFSTNGASSTSYDSYPTLSVMNPPSMRLNNNNMVSVPGASPAHTISPFTSDGTVTSSSNPHIPSPFEQEHSATLSVDVVDSLDPIARMSSSDKKLYRNNSISASVNTYKDPIDLGYLTKQEATYLMQW